MLCQSGDFEECSIDMVFLKDKQENGRRCMCMQIRLENKPMAVWPSDTTHGPQGLLSLWFGVQPNHTPPNPRRGF